MLSTVGLRRDHVSMLATADSGEHQHDTAAAATGGGGGGVDGSSGGGNETDGEPRTPCGEWFKVIRHFAEHRDPDRVLVQLGYTGGIAEVPAKLYFISNTSRDF